MSNNGRVRERRHAVVTGASAGIGRAFAERLAGLGFDLTIVARGAERLDDVARELREAHGGEVQTIAADLSTPLGLDQVEAHVREVENLRLLVNNAGFGTTGPFAQADIDIEEQQIRLNVVAVVRLTHAALARMVPAGRGMIVNVSSVAGFQPGPFDATYAATKAYLTNFTEALYEELRGSGVRVQALCPGFTRTEFQERAGWSRNAVPRFAWQEADEVVEASLRALRRNQAVCVPGWHNKVLVATSTKSPRGLVRRISGFMSRRSFR